MAYDYANLKQFTKGQIGGLTKRLNGHRFNSGSNQDTWTAIFKDAETIGLEVGYCEAHGERLDFKTPRKITKEQTEFGKTWLKNYFFKKDGKPRSGKRTEYVDSDVLNIAKRVVRFEFVGVNVLASQGWYPCQVVPIYRAYDPKGNYFDYSPIHWGEPIFEKAVSRE